MISFEAVLGHVAGLDAGELHRWIAERWVLPEAEGERYFFREVDVARVRLIVELKELAIDEEALPVVLRLLDRVYALRRQLRALTAAVERQPAATRDAIADRLRLELGEE